VLRVVGSDPGTSSLDLLLLVDGAVADQVRLVPAQLRNDPEVLARRLGRWAPIDLIAAPSGYGLPLVRGDAFTGVAGFRAWVRAFVRSGVPLVFLPGGLHLPTIPAHRKAGSVDVGTPDKVAVAALALRFDATEWGDFDRSTFAVVEIGTAFSAILVVSRGRLVDASAGTRGPIGLRSGGSWDGELAYWRSPLCKEDLFRGGLADLGAIGPDAFRESLIKHTAALKAVTPFERIYLSGRGLEHSEIAGLTTEALAPFGRVIPLPSLPGAWVKHAAQGAALLADALAGGRHRSLADSLQLASASGSIWGVLSAPRREASQT
jgi:predicted butyrate kinase (DUF1464 family)